MGAPSLGPESVTRALRRHSIRRGLLGGNRFWLVVFVLLRLAKWSGDVTKRGPMPIRFHEALKPGEGYVITHLDPKAGGAAPRP